MGKGARWLLDQKGGQGRDEWPHFTEGEVEAKEEHGVRLQVMKWQRFDCWGWSVVIAQQCTETAPPQRVEVMRSSKGPSKVLQLLSDCPRKGVDES